MGKGAKVCKCVQGHARRCVAVQEYACACENIRWRMRTCGSACKGMQGHVRSCEGLREYVRACEGVQGCERVFNNVFLKMYSSMHSCFTRKFVQAIQTSSCPSESSL